MIKSKTITIVMVTLVIAIIAAYFFTVDAVFHADKLASVIFSDISKAAEQGNWTEAKEKLKDFQKNWQKWKHLIPLNYGDVEFSTFEDTIARLEAAIKLKEKYAAVSEAASAKELWKNFVRIVPKP